MPAETMQRNTFSRRFWPMFLFGLVGVAALPLGFVSMLQAYEGLPELQHIPRTQLILLSLLQPLLLLAVCSALGAALAERLGFFSHLAARFAGTTSTGKPFSSELIPAVMTGAAVAVLTLALEYAVFKPNLPDFFEMAAQRQPRDFAMTLSGILYGGITEEIISRWGLMSLFTWAAWKIFWRKHAHPHSGAVIIALVLSALVFGLLHLPATAALAPLSEWLVVRVLTLNMLAALAYGWLYWRHSLEAAMLAHAFTHVALTAAIWTAGV